MKLRTILLISTLFVSQAFADPHPGDNPGGGATNKDGSIVTGILTAQFSVADQILPLPSNLIAFGLGFDDLTINIPVEDPTDRSNPLVALNSVDGFSTTEKWITTFVEDNGNPSIPNPPGNIDPASVIPGHSVRVFQVSSPPPYLAVLGIVRELTPGLEYWAQAAPGGIVAIIPLKPLAEYSTFMAVLTNDIKDTRGNDATPDQQYYLAKSRTPWIDPNGESVTPLLDNETAQSLESLRQLTSLMELNAAGAGVNPDDIILAWTVQTQSITPTLKSLRAIAQPAPVQAGTMGIDTSAVGGFGLADIFIGVITVPYYGGAPSPQNPLAPLTDVHLAEPGAYVPPFDQFGLDPTSTNITVGNPFPVPTGMQTVPILITVPSAASGFSKPANGWPVVIYVQSLTRSRLDMLALADANASAGLAMIAMDLPLHGVVPEVTPEFAPFYIENTPFGAIANERTFDADYFDNETGALILEFDPDTGAPIKIGDGIPDPTGSSYFNLLNLRAIRDNQRQAQADISILAASLQNISFDGDTVPDFDTSNVSMATTSLGVFVGTAVLAVEPIISRAYLNTGGAHGMRTIMAGSFGDRVNAALAAAGVLPGTVDYERFLLVAQTMLDPTDPANWATALVMKKMPIIHNQVQGDDTVPNLVAGAPMGGNEGLNALLDLASYSSSQVNPDGLHGVARFTKGEHGSLFRPTFPDVTAEMQGQMRSFLVSLGTLVNVNNPDILVPVIPSENVFRELPSTSGKGKRKKRPGATDDRRLHRLIGPINKNSRRQ